jgi:uncharacterized membrane protein YhaH (DUF805 family)
MNDMNFLNFYFGLKGRCSRKQYWLMYMSPVLAVWLLVGDIMRLLGLPVTPSFAGLLFAITVWIAIAVHVKRWHDIDFSGWWVLLGLVPAIGVVALIVTGCIRGSVGTNRFGSDPRIMSEHTWAL